jgi:hypothetical protein
VITPRDKVLLSLISALALGLSEDEAVAQVAASLALAEEAVRGVIDEAEATTC